MAQTTRFLCGFFVVSGLLFASAAVLRILRVERLASDGIRAVGTVIALEEKDNRPGQQSG